MDANDFRELGTKGDIAIICSCRYSLCPEWREESEYPFAGNDLRRTDRGLVMRVYCFGLRFTTRGSTRPGRDGLTFTTEGSSPFPSTPINQRIVSIKLIRSGATSWTRADST